jgi:hypothetical protein
LKKIASTAPVIGLFFKKIGSAAAVGARFSDYHEDTAVADASIYDDGAFAAAVNTSSLKGAEEVIEGATDLRDGIEIEQLLAV